MAAKSLKIHVIKVFDPVEKQPENMPFPLEAPHIQHWKPKREAHVYNTLKIDYTL